MTKTIALFAFAGAASVAAAQTPREVAEINPATLFDATGIEVAADTSASAISTVTPGDTFSLSGFYTNGTDFFGFHPDDATTQDASFSSTPQTLLSNLGSPTTQLGNEYQYVGTEGTNTDGSLFVQIDMFSNDGSPIGASAFGLDTFALAVGLQAFLGGPADNPLSIDLAPGEQVVITNAFWGFVAPPVPGSTDERLLGFNVTSFVGQTGAGGGELDFFVQVGLGTVTGPDPADVAGFLANTDQTVLNIDYIIIPTPAGAAVLGLGGLVAARRRR